MEARLVHNGLKDEGGQVMLVHPGWVQSYMRGELDVAADLTPEQSAQHIAVLIDRHEQFKGDQPAYVDDLSVALFTETLKLDTNHLDMLINNAAILGSITDHIRGPLNMACVRYYPLCTPDDANPCGDHPICAD